MITTQKQRERWGYVIVDDDDLYVSPYRWHTEEAAREAGEADAAACVAYETAIRGDGDER